MKKQLLSQYENNSVYYILVQIKLFLSVDKNNSNFDALNSHELLSYSEKDLEHVGKILSITNLRKMAWYFLDYGAATATILHNRLGITEPTTYRYLKDLKNFNFISLAIRARKARGKKGGPRPEVWMVPHATTADINEAQKRHRNLMSPKYLYAERMAQLMLDEYMIMSHGTVISKVTYIEFLREKQVKTSIIPDIVMLSVPYFREKGFKFIGHEGQKI